MVVLMHAELQGMLVVVVDIVEVEFAEIMLEPDVVVPMLKNQLYIFCFA
jgi:hypothetical protein